MVKLLIVMLILTFPVHSKEFNEQHLYIEPITWEELQAFQAGSIQSTESLGLSENCPTDLNGIKQLKQGNTAFKEILWSHYYWTEFENTDGLKCLVKHVGFNFNPNKKFGPIFYEILTSQQAQTLLSAVQSIGFREKGVNVIRHHVGKHNGVITEKPYMKYGGLQSIMEFKNKNKPEVFPNYNENEESYLKYKNMSKLEVFESYYSNETLNNLIEMAKSEAVNRPKDNRYPFQSKAE